MENILHTLVTLLAALLVATGTPGKGGELPSRPAVVEQSPAPMSDPIGVLAERGATQEVRGSEPSTEIDRPQSVDGNLDIQTKDAEGEASTALKVQAPTVEDSSSNSTGNAVAKEKDKLSVAEKELGSPDASTDDSSQDVKPVWDAKDQHLTKRQQMVTDDQSKTQTIKPEDSKSPEHTVIQGQPSDTSSQRQVETKQDSSKSNDSKDSHTETKSSDDHKSQDSND